MRVSQDSTRTTPNGSSLQPLARALACSVLWHTLPERVGERALLIAGQRRGEHELQRLEPLFGPPGRPAQQPLADLSVSRQPLRIQREGDGATLRFERSGRVRVDGQPLSGALHVSSAALERGVVVELSAHVALVLHWVSPSPRAAELPGLIGESDALHTVRRQLLRVAQHQVPVLLLGESGTGKELLARAIHEHGPRRSSPFVAVNMAAMPQGTAADALFGHSRGAFTGAANSAPGYFLHANGGTLFLDEIGATPLDVQAALLRALEAGEVQPLGGGLPRKVDVRIVAATDAKLDDAVAEGRFSLPLLHRLRGYELRMPALRERREDVGRLLRHFLASEPGGPLGRESSSDGEPWLPARLVAELALTQLPGNVRELKQLARRLVIDWGDAPRVDLATLVGSGVPPAASTSTPARPGSGAAPRGPAAPSEQELLEALERAEWRPSRAAALLGVSRSRIYAWIQRSPSLGTASSLRPERIAEQLVACSGDIEQAARALKVSPRGLLLRLRGSGLAGNSSETGV